MILTIMVKMTIILICPKPINFTYYEKTYLINDGNRTPILFLRK